MMSKGELHCLQGCFRKQTGRENIKLNSKVKLVNPINADDTTLYSKCDRTSDLWQQLELASELESDLRDTVDWGKKWLVDFNTGKTQLV